MSFSAEKIHFLIDFSFFSRHFGSSNCAGLKSFFSAKINLNTACAQSFSNSRKTVGKKVAVGKTARFFSFTLLSSSSIQLGMMYRLLFTVKRNCSVFIHDLERVNEFLCLNEHVLIRRLHTKFYKFG